MKQLLHGIGDLVVTLLGIALVTFLFLHALPGEPAEIYAGEEATTKDVEAIRVRLGLDRPLPIQFIHYMKHVAAGDLGTSLRSGKPLLEEIGARLPTTLRLAGIATAFALGVAIPCGVAVAANPDSPWGRAIDWIG